jgi:hypothetical protein
VTEGEIKIELMEKEKRIAEWMQWDNYIACLLQEIITLKL